ncbi:MAG: glycerol acyltransferase [Prevotella sp.]|nr:glycerol acyltransferase [Prevotella sp.]
MAQLIDIDKILRDKAGERAKRIPRFVVAWLKHIVHQDWANAFLVRAGDKTGTAWLVDCLDYLGVKLVVKGEENLPDSTDGRLYTFVSNHPMGGIDGVAIGSVIGKHYGDNFKYLVNDLLMNLPGLAPLCVAINKTGRNGRDFPKVVERTFASRQHILMFPAGLCSRRTKGVIHDLPWKKTFITKSVETGRDIVPIYFEGRNSNFFYRLANISKLLGIKFNIAMLFLADELYKNCNNTYTITIGKPIPVGTFDCSRSPAAWAAWVCGRCYALGEKERIREI